MSAYVGSSKNLKDLKDLNLYTSLCTGELNVIRMHKCVLCSPFYGRKCRWAILGELKPKGHKGPVGQRQVTLGGKNYTTTSFSFYLWCLTDFTSSPRTMPRTLWGIRGWKLYAPTMGYHEPHKG